MRDRADNFVVICSIENIDPMGVHTGDSITVAPALTLTDKEYQRMRDIGRRIIRRVGVETGGSNIQFAINPDDGRIVVIEMNPRVSRSSALGVEGDRLPDRQDRRQAGARLHARRDPQRHHAPHAGVLRADDRLHRRQGAALGVREVPARRSDADDADEVGGRGDGDRPHLQGSLHEGVPLARARARQHAVREERRPHQRDRDASTATATTTRALQRSLAVPNDQRMWAIFTRARARLGARGNPPAHEHRPVVPDPVQAARRAQAAGGAGRAARDFARPDALAQTGRLRRLADRQHARRPTRRPCRAARLEQGLQVAYKRIDTCAAEFESFTPYLYGTYEKECEADPTPRQKVIILGSGPNRIGQGIEFDYCCVHAAFALRDDGFETVMINCNPETVSTDYDTVDRLYFEPLTFEDVFAIIEREREAGGEVSVVVSTAARRRSSWRSRCRKRA